MSFVNWLQVNDAKTVSVTVLRFLDAGTLEFWDMFEKAECFQSCCFGSLRLKGNNKIKTEKYLEKMSIVLLANSAVEVPPLK